MAGYKMSRFVLICGLFFEVDGRAGFFSQSSLNSLTPGVDAEATQGNLNQRGLRGGAPFEKDVKQTHKDMRENFEKYGQDFQETQKDIQGDIHNAHKDMQEKLASIPNHWDIPLVPSKVMTWHMFARVAEKETLLSVHRGYMMAWCGSVTLLLILTVAFVALSHNMANKDSEAVCQPFHEVPTGESENYKVLMQKGFVTSPFGSSVFWLWVLLPLLGYAQMSIIAMDHYLFAMHEPDLTWNQWAQPYLLVFCLSHLTLFLQTQYLARARVFFMLPEPLPSATKVLIQNPESSTADGALVDVQINDVRFFEHTCVRYLWSDANGHFVPVGTETGLTGKEATRRVQQGGLTKDQLNERKVIGPNEINVPVPGIFASLAEEFLTPLYCFQFAAMWLYLFIDGWNISAVWLVWTLTAGISKSLCIVRRNRLKVQALARTSARAIVLREGQWRELSSAEVVPGDVIQVDETVVCCDVLMVEGGAVVNESMLTGEPMPVQRFAVESIDSEAVSAASHKKHLLFTGTVVMQSSGNGGETESLAPPQILQQTPRCESSDSTLVEMSLPRKSVGVVLNTGPMTMKGSLIRTVLFPEPIAFKFSDQLPRVYLIMFVYVCCLFTVMQLFSDTGSWIFSLYIGFTILVQSLNPLLPVAISLGQSVGCEQLKNDTGVSCLAPQRLPIAGKVHIMVMDKTGTITKEGMEFRGVQVAGTSAFVDPPSWAEDGCLDSKGLPEAVVWAMAACHTVTRLRGDGGLVGNMVEVAMLNASGWQLSDDSKRVCEPSGTQIEILKQLEFDQKRMTSGSVIQVDGKKVALIKGSYERIGELATSGLPQDYKEVTEGFAREQYYVLGIGMKALDSKGELASRDDLEKDITFLGLFLFRNEMKSDSPEAAAALREGGTRSCICTGDNALTGAAIGRRIGLIPPGRSVILGDLRNGSLSWITQPDKVEVPPTEVIVPHTEVIESNEDAELVITEKALLALKPGEREKVSGRVRGRWTGLILPGRVIRGDLVNESLSWTTHSAEVPHTKVIESNEDAELVITKTAFRALEPSELLKVSGSVRVYARMKPDDKVAVVQLYQAQGLVVGMVGDGGNDCGAMRAAHVGLALSEAEASIVAPFSSGATYGTGEKSLMAVPHLLRYGRATLQTNSGSFLFFMVYGFTLPTSKLVQTLGSSAMMAEWDWLFIDIALGVGFVLLMTNSRPSDKLAPIRPTAALLEGRSLSSLLLHITMFFTFYAISLNVLWAQPFHVTYDTKNINIPANEWPKKGDNYDCAVTFLIVATQLVTAGYAGCLGAEHRKNVLKDWSLTLTFLVIMGFFLALVLGGPTNMHCVFRVNCDNKVSRNMYVPFIQEFSAGNVGGCFLGPQLQGWKEELGERWQFPDEKLNKCFPADGFDPEERLSVPSDAFFFGSAMCQGPNNCFGRMFRIYFAVLLCLQAGLSILCHKLLLMWHPAPRQHFKTL